MKNLVGSLICFLAVISTASACLNDSEVKIVEDNLKNQTISTSTPSEKNGIESESVSAPKTFNQAGVAVAAVSGLVFLAGTFVYFRRK